MLTFEGAGERPVFIVESGPAAGVIATSHLARTLGLADAISFDMGGTTAKVGLVRGGQPQITTRVPRRRDRPARAWARRVAPGYPIRTPVIELAEIGAGGGSIAWVDTGGALRVGPMSAGAEPGPAAYGRGGTEPTVTDANLVLGRLGADSFLGGELHLDVDAAARAIERACAKPLGVDVVSAAYGIVEIANAAMASALRLMSVQRGLDPRTFALVGFGGAGPVHANRLASEMGVVTTIVPPSPGTFSALGLLLNDLRHDFSQTFLRRTATVDMDAMRAIYERLEADGRAMLRREQVPDADVVIEYGVEMQYVGQSYMLPIPLPQRDADRGRHGRRRAGVPRRPRPRVRLQRPGRADRDRQPAPRGRRADPAVGARGSRPSGRRGRAEADPAGLLRGDRRLRRDADLRPGGARARRRP